MIDIKKILEEHSKWLQDHSKGVRANLTGADLRNANLSYADLRDANLSYANLTGADLRNANLSYADLRDANLSYANLTGADLRNANLSYADLRDANLSYANLTGADLRNANLSYADLRDANLTDTTFSNFQIPQNTDLIGWGKKNKVLVKLLIPKEAKRTSTPIGKKCRAEFIKVLKVYNKEKEAKVTWGYIKTLYKEGELVHPDSYNSDIRKECTHGIHFFLTKKEAEAWNF